MNCTRLHALVSTVCWLLVLISAQRAGAQLAPTGGHYAGRSSDTGHEPGLVNMSGGYAASVPLDLPAARGALPIPLQITFGSRGVGAAGVGWDVPLSYVRRDTSFAGRRPASEIDAVPRGREQVVLSLLGRSIDLVPKGAVWVARHNAPQLSLREENGTWLLFDGQGRTYVFTAPPALVGAGVWLLSSVSGSGGTRVQLEYEIGTPALPDSSGVSIDLVRLQYNGHPSTGCTKDEVTLAYGASAGSPLGVAMFGNRVLTRMRTLSAVEVKRRASCSEQPESLRRYELTYRPDRDTQQPRLQLVEMYGREGTAEANTPMVVARYSYGSASNSERLRYQKTQTIALPAGVDSTSISSTMFDSTASSPSGDVGYATWQSLTDVSGDGRPDLVFRKGNTLWVARNRPGIGGTTSFGAGPAAPLSDTTFASGAFELRAAGNHRFSYGASRQNIDEVWRQAIDVNGDGRVDIVDAGEEEGQWVIYLNTPGGTASGVKWERRSYAINRLQAHLQSRGHNFRTKHLPLARRFTSRDRTVNACWRFDGTNWVPFPGGWSIQRCYDVPNQLLGTGPEKTFTEWEVTDFNGDGYPDLVFNSSRADLVPSEPPVFEDDELDDVRGGPALIRAQPLDGDANAIEAVFNVRGVLFHQSTNPFSAPVRVKSNAACGVALWAETAGTQHVVCGIADVNGDGYPDRIEDRRVFLGTGSGFSGVWFRLPEAFATQRSDQVSSCVDPEPDAPGATTYGAYQSMGLRDLTGDGIPDFVVQQGSSWRVSIGTGIGFASPPIDVDSAAFAFSFQRERCDGRVSRTRGGLYDIDGDGKPEVVVVGAQALDVYQLAGGSVPGTPEAGRLVHVESGFGVKSTIRYRSAKEDGTTLHQVPFPEVVVTSIETTGTQGLGGTLSATRYAYGDAELVFDSALDSFTLPAYGRAVVLLVTSRRGPSAQGVATLTDTYRLAPFAPTPKNERFGRYARVGRVRDVTVVSGSLGADPWALLSLDVTTDSRRTAATHYDWAARLFEEPAVPGSTPLDCIEHAHPYDFLASFYASVGTLAYDACSAHGFVYGVATESWRGAAAPPATMNVATRSEALEVDDFGRVINVLHEEDRHRADDDICVETIYAAPVGPNAPILSAPVSRRLWDCRRQNLATYAAERWEYDNLPPGSVAAGFVTSHTVERRATDDGTLLNVLRQFDAALDAAGNPIAITATREDGATRSIALEYEPFGLAPLRTRIEATGTPSVEVFVVRDAITLDALSVTDANQTVSGADFDGFGRLVRSTVTPPGGTLGVRATVTYLGFSGSDPLGRRIVSKSFGDPVTPGSEDAAAGRTATLYLDELGRERRTEVRLGPDYANQMLIVGARTYDGLGGVAFAADPFLSTEDASTAYGTTYFFRTDGSPSCFIRGRGPQALTAITNEPIERYPTCFSRSFAAHQETVGVRDPSSLLASSAQAGVTRLATVSAVGRVLSRSTAKNGVRLEHATFMHDRLGQLTSMTRFQDPVAATNPVQSSWRLDSMGRFLELHEPEAAVQYARYSNWGELLEVRWTDPTSSPATERRLLNTYDALGRLTHREERNNGVTDLDTVNDYIYDQGLTVTPHVTPTHLVGRLARAKAPTGEVLFSYDALGRVNARTFIDTESAAYIEKTIFQGDGAPSALEFYLPDTAHKRERVEYSYDSARRLRAIKFVEGEASRELYAATEIDPLGRVRTATYAGSVTYDAKYAALGRRMMNEVTVSSATGSRRIIYLGYDPLGRERSRREIHDGGATGPKTNVGYDALGRLSTSLQTNGATTSSSRQFAYDPLGNVLELGDGIGVADATLSYGAVDRDRACRIGYGNGGLGGTACNVVYDGVGNIVQQATRTGQRHISYFASGGVRTIAEASALARFRYGAFADLQELNVEGPGVSDTRRDRRYGGLIERRDQVVGGAMTSIIWRRIPGLDGIVASRRGAGDQWIFHFGESRGGRFFTDASGAFVQDLNYQAYGETTSSGAPPSSAQYTPSQWNGGDALAAFGLAHLGARLYDPIIGRFLSRDPWLVPRTAATTNPYAFAMNDPINFSDPSGLDPCNECPGPSGSGSVPGGGPTEINPPGLYLPPGAIPSGANPQAAYRAPVATTFSSAPKGPQTAAGRALRKIIADNVNFELGDNFNFDSLAAQGLSYDEMLEKLEHTGEAQRSRDRFNARINSFSSFFAHFGDALNWACLYPGCGRDLRAGFGIESGDADQWAGFVGSVTGIAGMVAAPRPTIVVPRPPPVTASAGSSAALYPDSLYTFQIERIAGYQLETAKGLVGNTFVRRILHIGRIGGATHEIGPLMRLIEALKAEAIATGATRMQVEGLAVENVNFFRASRLWEKLGVTFVPIGNNRFEIIVNLSGR